MAILSSYFYSSQPGLNLIAVLLTLVAGGVIAISCLLYQYLRKRFPKENKDVIFPEKENKTNTLPEKEEMVFSCISREKYPEEGMLVLLSVSKYYESPEDSITVSYTTCGIYEGDGRWSVLEEVDPLKRETREFRWRTGLSESKTEDFGLLQIVNCKAFPQSEALGKDLIPDPLRDV